MALRVDLEEILADENSIKTRVRVRCANLMDNGSKLSSHNIDLELKARASEESPRTPLIDVIKSLVKEVAYAQARLSLREFIERFKKNRLHELIAAKFVNSLYAIDAEYSDQNGGPKSSDLSPEQLQEIEHEVMKNVIGHMEQNNLTSTETLYEYTEQQKRDWPMVDVSKLFLEEFEEKDLHGQWHKTTLRGKISQKILTSLNGIAAAAYKEKFDEDKRGFVMGFMMGRVVKYDAATKQMVFDEKEFWSLMSYLDGIGYAITRVDGQSLYDWLYYDSREMHKHLEELRVKNIQFGIRGQLAEASDQINLEQKPAAKNQAEEVPFFQENFDVKAFYDQYIWKAVFRFYSRKLKKMGVVREVDLLNKLLDSKNLGRTNYTVQLIRFLQVMIETGRQNPQDFMAKLRELLGLENSPTLKDLSDLEVQKHFEKYLQSAQDKFERMLEDALSYRNDADIKKSCSYPPEILGCRDVLVLMEWFVYPDVFKKAYPVYENLTNEQISFMCGTFLREFLNNMEVMSSEQFAEAEKRRDLIEENMKEALNIVDIKNIDIHFRDIEELDEDGNSLQPPKFDFVLDDKDVAEFVSDFDRDLANLVMHDGDLVEVLWKGKRLRIYPQEKKHFKKVKMRIPEMKFNEEKNIYEGKTFREVTALIYSGDDHLIHSKEALTRVISQDRGKEVSDESRWMLCFANIEDLNSFKAFIYGKNPKGMVKVEDAAEKRVRSNKGRTVSRTKSTSEFKKNQDFVYTVELSYPLRGSDGQIQVKKAMLESQCQRLKWLLLKNLSKYTPASHDVYRAQRSWPILFSHYFPPEIFGDRFKVFLDEGYRKE